MSGLAQRSYVVTGGAQGVGAAIVDVLARDAHVVILDIVDRLDSDRDGVQLVSGAAGDPAAALRAAAAAESAAPLCGWVNNAAVFRDAGLCTASAPEVLELIGANGIRSNAVALGLIRTARYEAYCAEHPEVDAQMAALHPLGRVGTAVEVADVVAFLLSPASGFVNGVTLPVDGGRAAQGADPEAD